MGLQARGTAGVDSASTGGTWDISNADRLGRSEIELVNIFIEGKIQDSLLFFENKIYLQSFLYMNYLNLPTTENIQGRGRNFHHQFQKQQLIELKLQS